MGGDYCARNATVVTDAVGESESIRFEANFKSFQCGLAPSVRLACPWAGIPRIDGCFDALEYL